VLPEIVGVDTNPAKSKLAQKFGMMRMTPSQLYVADFYAWTRHQATRPNLPLDLEHIAEEIRDLGKRSVTRSTAWHGSSCRTSCSSSTPPRPGSGGTGWTRSTSSALR
jgi:hypothetical protein